MSEIWPSDLHALKKIGIIILGERIGKSTEILPLCCPSFLTWPLRLKFQKKMWHWKGRFGDLLISRKEHSWHPETPRQASEVGPPQSSARPSATSCTSVGTTSSTDKGWTMSGLSQAYGRSTRGCWLVISSTWPNNVCSQPTGPTIPWTTSNEAWSAGWGRQFSPFTALSWDTQPRPHTKPPNTPPLPPTPPGVLRSALKPST